MSEKQDKKPGILTDIRKFGSFVRSLWGIVATISLLFPYANKLTGALPFPKEDMSGPSTTFASIGSAFIFLLVYRSRYSIHSFDDPQRRLSSFWGFRKIPFGKNRSAILALISFLLFVVFLLDYLYRVWTGALGPPFHYPTLVNGVMEYSGIFMAATFSFSILATAEYMRQMEEITQDLDYRWPTLEEAFNLLYLRLPSNEQALFQGFRVLSEKRGLVDDLPVLEVVAQYRYSNTSYEWFRIELDGKGVVRNYEKLDQSQI